MIALSRRSHSHFEQQHSTISLSPNQTFLVTISSPTVQIQAQKVTYTFISCRDALHSLQCFNTSDYAQQYNRYATCKCMITPEIVLNNNNE